MSDLPPQITNWLYNVLQPQYINKQLTYAHICQFLSVHFGKNSKFKVRTSVYTSSNTGQSSLLINLFGNLQTKSKIDVPIEIWIPFNYPYGQSLSNTEGVPLVFINPDIANGMYLIPGNNVDGQGLFYHPYLADWYHEFVTSDDTNRLSKKYNLLVLTKILQENFDQILPVYLNKEISSIGATHSNSKISHNPPKPAKIAISAHDSISPQSTGPPLPQKVLSNMNSSQNLSSFNKKSPPSIGVPRPSKYDSPLPLPSVISYARQDIDHHSISKPLADFESSYRVSSEPNNERSIGSSSLKTKEIVSKNNMDLMDNDETVSAGPTNDNIKQSILEVLSQNINACLSKSDSSVDNLNEGVPIINENSSKIGALYSQLSHHNKQAKANSENLKSHIQYLTQQLSNLSTLNSELMKLDEINSRETDYVSTSENNSIDINDVIIPDSALVKQLYETVSEIKAMKDSINLIAGNFRSEPEIINNERLDICIKSIRGLGRDIFWNELMKSELVSSITGLSN